MSLPSSNSIQQSTGGTQFGVDPSGSLKTAYDPAYPWQKHGSALSSEFGLSTKSNAQPFQQGDMMQDPATGLYVDRNTGKIYSDPSGQRPVSNLDLQGLTARAGGISNNLYDQANNTNNQFGGAVGAQQQFAGSLQDVINGTAPSVAQDQLYQTLGNIRSQQLSAASGNTGENMALANQNAQRNISANSIAAGNDAATLRATETATARQQQGNTLGQISNELGNQYQTQLGGAGTAGGQALQSQTTNTTLDQQNKEDNKKILFGDGSSGGAVQKAGSAILSLA